MGLGDRLRKLSGRRDLPGPPADPDPHPIEDLVGLAAAHVARYSETGAPADLEHAIRFAERAVATMPEGHPLHVGCLHVLGHAHWRRYARDGAAEDLRRATELLGQVAARTPDTDPDRSDSLNSLAGVHIARYDAGGSPADLDRAIELLELAWAALPGDHPERGVALNNLGLSYRRRYVLGGVVADLERAIDYAERSVATIPAGHVRRPLCLSNLGLVYRMRYDRDGVADDLERAIELGEEAVATISVHDPQRAGRLTDLSSAYRARFYRDRASADLDRAIALDEQAVAATPVTHPNRGGRLSNLGGSYQSRYDDRGGASDLERAVESGERAVAATSADDPDRGARLSALGLAYRRRHERDGASADLERAVELAEQAVAATPVDNSERARRLAVLALDYRTRLAEDRGSVTRKHLRLLARQVEEAVTAPPADRVYAGHQVGALAHAIGDDPTAVRLLDTAVALLPSVAPRAADWADQEHRLGQHTGVVEEAIAVHCALGDPVGAVEVAELGRGILLGTRLASRTDLTELDAAHPELAARFRQVRDRLDTAVPAGPVGASIDERKARWADHDVVLARIRQQPRFAGFLLPPRLADLRPAAGGGAVVLVNAGERRGDAIVITADAAPVAVELGALAWNDVVLHSDALLRLTGSSTGMRQQGIPEILGWLWDAIVAPVLDALPVERRRVWWLPTGLLGLFPLHAAGRAGRPGALDLLVSSYVPTLRALAHARSRPPATARRQLTVALASTPGLPELPGTAAEAADLHARHPATTHLADRQATTGRVLAALGEATWAHFACHAGADQSAPSRGGLRLHDATLPIPRISRLDLAQAELAYLSACHTAHGGVRHIDESIHLASAFHLAGFRHVVASLWPLNDTLAARAARSFYRRMPPIPTADQAAHVLHRVTRELRDRHPDRPDLWASLVHSGP